MIQLIVVCIQAGNNATEALEASDLAEHEREELVPVRQATKILIFLVFANKCIEFVMTNVVSNLGKNVAVFVHGKEGEM